MAGYLVIGLGTFGRSVTQTLYENGKMVLAIDQREDRVQKVIDDEIASDAITLDVTDENSIRKVINDDFDTAFVCIGDNTQSSVFVTVILKEMGIKTIICKAKNELPNLVALYNPIAATLAKNGMLLNFRDKDESISIKKDSVSDVFNSEIENVVNEGL